MEHFIYFSDKVADGIEGLSIVDKRYDDLIQENDTVRIFSGPLAVLAMAVLYRIGARIVKSRQKNK